VLGEITLDAALLDYRVGAGHGPAPPIRRKAAPNSNDSTRPSAPATVRMTPTVLRLNPKVVTSTAKVKMAASTARKEPARLDAVYTRTAYSD
jgi:hypothetical protein